ncbi:MAG: alpha/beta hydrolase [Chloroflexota bacterium]
MQTATRKRRIWAKVLAVALVVLIVAYLGISVYVADKLSHPTRKSLTTDPSKYGMQYENVDFSSTVDNVPLKGWFIDTPGTTRTLLVMHGRNSTKDNRIDMEVMQGLTARGYDIFTFDFRAHGDSGGDRYSLGPWETRDVAGALAWLKGHGVDHVGALAYSMGAATEILSAPDHPEMTALVLDSPFSDLPALLDKELPRASGLPGFFNPGILLMGQLVFGLNLLDTKPVRQIAELKERPIFLIHGDADQLVPVAQAYELQKAASGDPNFTLWIVPGAAHVGSFDVNKQEYLTRVGDFFDKNLK